MVSTQDKWRSAKIHNSYGLVERYTEETGEIGVYIGYSSNDGQRFNIGVHHGYITHRPGYRTDPNPERSYYGDKVFYQTWQAGETNKQRWESALNEAVQWTRERYGVGAFGPIPGFGRDRFPAEIIAWAKQKVKEL